MAAITNEILLKDKDILTEIQRHKWIESEKAGHDIGFERASREWINNYAEKYLARHPNKTSLLWFKSQAFYNFLNQEVNF